MEQINSAAEISTQSILPKKRIKKAATSMRRSQNVTAVINSSIQRGDGGRASSLFRARKQSRALVGGKNQQTKVFNPMSSHDAPLPKAEEVLKFLSRHSSRGGGLNLFPQQFKKKREIDDKPPIAQILYRSGQDDLSDYKKA